MRPFAPLTDDCFAYYAVENNFPQKARALWDAYYAGVRPAFSQVAMEIGDREKAAFKVGFPYSAGILKPEFQQPFSQEYAPPSHRETVAVVQKVPYENDRIAELAAYFAHEVNVHIAKPILRRILHSWLNHDVQVHGGMPGGKVMFMYDNKIIDPQKFKSSPDHQDDPLDRQFDFPPSRIYAMRTAVSCNYRDAEGNQRRPREFEALVYTGDQKHGSAKPEPAVPTPSKIITLIALTRPYSWSHLSRA